MGGELIRADSSLEARSTGYYLRPEYPEYIDQFYTGYQLRIPFQRLEDSIEWRTNYREDKWGLGSFGAATPYHTSRIVPHEAHLSITVGKGDKLSVRAFIDSPQRRPPDDTSSVYTYQEISGEMILKDLI